MNNMYRIFALFFFVLILSVSCSNENENNNENKTTTDTTEKITTKKILKFDSFNKKQTDTIKKFEKKRKKELRIYKYVCPLGCKKGQSDTKGTCPECGMEFIENPDYTTKKQ